MTTPAAGGQASGGAVDVDELAEVAWAGYWGVAEPGASGAWTELNEHEHRYWRGAVRAVLAHLAGRGQVEAGGAVHRLPPAMGAPAPCCGRTVGQLPPGDRLTWVDDAVTCPTAAPVQVASGNQAIRRAALEEAATYIEGRGWDRNSAVSDIADRLRRLAVAAPVPVAVDEETVERAARKVVDERFHGDSWEDLKDAIFDLSCALDARAALRDGNA